MASGGVTSRSEGELEVLGGGGGSRCVSMICLWVSRAICWLSQTAGHYNYPGAGGGAGPACGVARLPSLPARSDVAHSQPSASQLHVCGFIPGCAFKCAHTRSVARL